MDMRRHSLIGDFVSTVPSTEKISLDLSPEFHAEILRATRARVAAAELEGLPVKGGKAETIRLATEAGLAAFWARWEEFGPRPRSDEEVDRIIEAAKRHFGAPPPKKKKRAKAEK
jgi:hypothetical protein